MLDDIRDLVEFDSWANQRMVEACSGLTQAQLRQEVPSSFPSVLATLQHMLGAEAVWLRRWRGTSPPGWPAELQPETIELVRDRWAELARDRQEWLAGVSEDELRRDFAYVNLRGEPWSHPLVQQIQHMVNHSTYHRGQIVTMLHQLGAPGFGTDLITFYRSRTGTA